MTRDWDARAREVYADKHPEPPRPPRFRALYRWRDKARAAAQLLGMLVVLLYIARVPKRPWAWLEHVALVLLLVAIGSFVVLGCQWVAR